MGFVDVLGSFQRDAHQIEGFWGNKTSSVNFCEEDYVYSTYIAEFHNTWTSLIFIWLPLLGLLRSNPSKEWRFVWAYIQLIITGIGSVILHTTLTSAGQQADEIPMLWMCSAIFYNLLTYKQTFREGFCKWTVLIPCFVIYQTCVYIYFQDLYYIFVFGYLSMVFTIIGWTCHMSYFAANEKDAVIRKWLWNRSIGMYVLTGSTSWMLDMHLCDYMSGYIRYFGGMTFHVLWHFGAAFGTYFMVLLIVAVRCQSLGKVPMVVMTKYGPVIEISKDHSQ